MLILEMKTLIFQKFTLIEAGFSCVIRMLDRYSDNPASCFKIIELQSVKTDLDLEGVHWQK
jgi:hypothetical protein